MSAWDMDTALLPRPVDTAGDTDDDTIHVFCSVTEQTWCGLDSSTFGRARTVEVEKVCRTCLAAFEVWKPSPICPVCERPGCR
jgi:hypothetical protein